MVSLGLMTLYQPLCRETGLGTILAIACSSHQFWAAVNQNIYLVLTAQGINELSFNSEMNRDGLRASALYTAKILGYSEQTESLMLEIMTFEMGQDLQPFF